MLAGGLPAHIELSRDLRPADAQADSMVDEHGQLGLRLLLRGSDTSDPLQDLDGGHPRHLLRKALGLRRRCLPRSARMGLLGLRAGPTLRLGHATSLSAGRQRVLPHPVRGNLQAQKWTAIQVR